MEAKESTRTRIGFSRMEKKYEWKDHVIFMGILLAMAVWVNRGIEIKGLYMDDLYFWSCYGEQSFLQYVFPVGSAFGAQLYYHMKEIMDFDGLLKDGRVDVIRDYLREHIHQYGKLKDSRQILKEVTGEDFNPEYYVRYLKEKYSRLYGLESKGLI